MYYPRSRCVQNRLHRQVQVGMMPPINQSSPAEARQWWWPKIWWPQGRAWVGWNGEGKAKEIGFPLPRRDGPNNWGMVPPFLDPQPASSSTLTRQCACGSYMILHRGLGSVGNHFWKNLDIIGKWKRMGQIFRIFFCFFFNFYFFIFRYFHDSQARGLATWGHLCPAACLASGYPGSDCWPLGFEDTKANENEIPWGRTHWRRWEHVRHVNVKMSNDDQWTWVEAYWGIAELNTRL